jgi:hypothetical protein
MHALLGLLDRFDRSRIHRGSGHAEDADHWLAAVSCQELFDVVDYTTHANPLRIKSAMSMLDFVEGVSHIR